ncbi:uncharacterized protein LOC117646770 [Thrips palmi]|uniref:Uncharacterized protein LOC117646770 n=1 Tax=Thrips palmi TaxID=161013 RepID=A0A6P8ZPC0_THRPL|nr:uncharacterized protein LOC117646770 [Thrips palmi]
MESFDNLCQLPILSEESNWKMRGLRLFCDRWELCYLNRVLMVKEPNVRTTGCFVGRLKGGPTLTENYIAEVKDLFDGDNGFEFFKPLLIRRKAVWRELGFFFITTEEEGSTPSQVRTLATKRNAFKETVLNMNFDETPKSHLEEVLESRNVGPCIDAFYAHLSRRNTPILYAANVDPLELGRAQKKALNLEIAENVSMGKMDSLIKYLVGDEFPGIVTPTLYVGNEASPFQCHHEDVSFEAVNMHVAGAPKIWLVI